MGKATLDVTPDILPMIPAALPRGVTILGSEVGGTFVRLVLQGKDIGGRLQMIVREEALKRTYELVPLEPEDG